MRRTATMPAVTGQPGLHEWFLRGLAADPAATALRIGAKSFTYQRLHERALALAGNPGFSGTTAAPA